MHAVKRAQINAVAVAVAGQVAVVACLSEDTASDFTGSVGVEFTHGVHFVFLAGAHPEIVAFRQRIARTVKGALPKEVFGEALVLHLRIAFYDGGWFGIKTEALTGFRLLKEPF